MTSAEVRRWRQLLKREKREGYSSRYALPA
jgi:hypothetical protein